MFGAHQSGEVEHAVKLFGAVIQAAGVAAVVDDDEHLPVLPELFQQIGIGLQADMLYAGSAQLFEKCGRIRGNFAHVFKAAVKAVFGLHGGLGGGAHHYAATVASRQLFDSLHHGQQQVKRQHLRFVENNHAAGDIVQLAAARGTVGKQRFEKLHGGGYHHGHIPVFGGLAQLVFAVLVFEFAVVEGAVVFQYGGFAQITEGFAELGGVLLDDAGKGNHVNHAPHAVVLGVFQSERHRGKGFAAAGGHGKGKQAGCLTGLGDGMVENVAAQAVKRGAALFGFGRRLFGRPSERFDKDVEALLQGV